MTAFLGGPAWPELDAALTMFDFGGAAEIAAASTAEDSAERLLATGACLAMTGRPDAAAADLHESFRLFTAARLPRAAATATVLGRLHYFVYDNPRVANGWFARARTAARLYPGTVEYGMALVPLPACDSTDNAILARDATAALDVARANDTPDHEAKALADLGCALVGVGQVSAGMTHLDEAMTMLVCGQARSPFAAIDIVCNLVSSCRLAGDLGRALEWLDEAEACVGLGHYDGPAFMYAHCQAALGLILLDLGREEAAEAALQLAALKAATVGGRSTGQVRSALAELRISQGRPHEAEDLLAGRLDHLDARRAVAGLAQVREAAPTPRYTDPLDVLTPREREVIALIGNGHTNAEIAELLSNSVRTIEHHVASILAKLGIRTRTEAAVLLASR